MGTGTSKGELFFIDCPAHLPSKCLLYKGPLTPALCLCNEHQRGLCHWAVILHSNNCLAIGILGDAGKTVTMGTLIAERPHTVV